MWTLYPASHEVVNVPHRGLSHRHLSGITGEYRDGVLHIRGRTRSFYQKQLAQETVRGVEGVLQVVNEIEVEPQRPAAKMCLATLEVPFHEAE